MRPSMQACCDKSLPILKKRRTERHSAAVWHPQGGAWCIPQVLPGSKPAHEGSSLSCCRFP